jgi:hypothetical protein
MNSSRLYLFGALLSLTLTGCASPSLKTGHTTTQAGQTRPPRVLSANATPLEKLIVGGVEQESYTLNYDPAYVKLDYPGGDVPLDRGVCADVVVRAFRKAGMDLQKEVHEDMKASFAAYPKNWGATRPDRNIDHRRVANLMTFFERKGKAVTVSKQAEDYRPGDVVAWELDSGRLHIGLVTDVKIANTERYAMVHNIAAGAQIEDVLFAWRIIGHYRYF